MKKLFRWTMLFVFALGVLSAIVSLGVYQAAHHEPAFYRQALATLPAEPERVADEFEQEVLELRNESQQPGVWQARFNTAQINGWLTIDFPSKFPDALPKGLEQPRVAIEDGRLRIAARYHDDQIKTVLSFSLRVALADEPNTIAVRVEEVCAGALPIPTSRWLEKVRAATQREDMHIRWSQIDGDPVAMLTIPEHHGSGSPRLLEIETVEIADGELRLAGSTREETIADAAAEAIGHIPLPPASENDTTQR